MAEIICINCNKKQNVDEMEEINNLLTCSCKKDIFSNEKGLRFQIDVKHLGTKKLIVINGEVVKII